MLSSAEHKKIFITSGGGGLPDLGLYCLIRLMCPNIYRTNAVMRASEN